MQLKMSDNLEGKNSAKKEKETKPDSASSSDTAIQINRLAIENKQTEISSDDSSVEEIPNDSDEPARRSSRSSTSILNSKSSLTSPSTQNQTAKKSTTPNFNRSISFTNSNTNNNNNNKTGGASSSASTSSNTDSQSSDNDEEQNDASDQGGIRVGDEYQVNMNEYNLKPNSTRSEIKAKEVCVWKPSSKLTDAEIQDYLNQATSKYAYNFDQALGLLYFNNYDIKQSIKDMSIYLPAPNEWTDEDKILFEHAYMFHGKNFNKIRQVLPDKSQASLVHFYYMWKKTKLHVSLIDQQQQNNKNVNSNENNDGNENGVGIDSDGDLNELNNENSSDDSADESFNNNINKICCNCDFVTTDLMSTPKGMLCGPCYEYWKNTGGLMRPDNLNKYNNASYPPPTHNNHNNYVHKSTNRYINTSEQNGNNNSNMTTSNMSKEAKNFHKTLRKPPKGIYLNYDELLNLAESDTDQIFDTLNRRLVSLKKEVQTNKQDISQILNKLSYENEFKTAINDALNEMDQEKTQTPGWNSNEVALAIQGFNKYGDDFVAISEILGTKSEGSVKAFYNYYKDNYGLDKLIINNPELITKANTIIADLTKISKPDVPIETGQPPKAKGGDENELKVNDAKSSPVASSKTTVTHPDDVIFISNDSN